MIRCSHMAEQFSLPPRWNRCAGRSGILLAFEPRHAFQTRPFAPVVDAVLGGLLAFAAPESRRYGAAREVFGHQATDLSCEVLSS